MRARGGIRMSRLRAAAVAGAAGLLGALFVAPPSSAASLTTLALWNMNETSGSTLVDSSGNGIDGTIGSEVVRNGSVHTFTYLKPNTPPAHPGHLDTVTAKSSMLNPGTRDYSITIRAKWTNAFGNII